MIKRTSSAAVIAAFLFALATAGPASQTRTPEFSLRAIDAEPVTSASLRGEVAVMAFGASWLPLSKNQLDGVKKLADDYAGKGVVVYWVSTDSENPKSRNFASDDQLRTLTRKYKITALRDPDGVVSKKLGVDQLPSVLIIDKQGNVAATVGGLDPNANLTNELSDRLKRLL